MGPFGAVLSAVEPSEAAGEEVIPVDTLWQWFGIYQRSPHMSPFGAVLSAVEPSEAAGEEVILVDTL
jgi:hypothetical protein